MMEMIVAGLPAQAITAAAELGIADALADGPLPIDELAARVERTRTRCGGCCGR